MIAPYSVVGGLVGAQTGTITASYAAGAVSGGEGDGDCVGKLVGNVRTDSLTASYGFGRALSGEIEGSHGSTKPEGVETATQLVAANAGPSWNSADSNTLGVWDFGTDEHFPALKYNDYDGSGTAFGCGSSLGYFPNNVCNTPLPGQRSGPEPGTSIDNSGGGPPGRWSLPCWPSCPGRIAGGGDGPGTQQPSEALVPVQF